MLTVVAVEVGHGGYGVHGGYGGSDGYGGPQSGCSSHSGFASRQINVTEIYL